MPLPKPGPGRPACLKRYRWRSSPTFNQIASAEEVCEVTEIVACFALTSAAGLQKEMVACSRANMNPTIRIPPPTAATTTFTVISRPEVEDEMSSAFACTLARPLVALAEEVLEAEELCEAEAGGGDGGGDAGGDGGGDGHAGREGAVLMIGRALIIVPEPSPLFVVLSYPSRPELPDPQHLTPPSFRSAHV